MLAWRGEHLRADAQQLLAAFATQLAVAVQSRRLAAEASTAATLAKANEMRTALLAAVSHDLRTPLASIRTAATSLLADDVDLDPSITKELLETIDDEAERLNTLVGNLLDMSRLQTGHFQIEQEAVGVDEVVGAALLGLHTPPDRVRIDVPEDLPRVITDPSLLERAVANLLDNALGFSPDGRAHHGHGRRRRPTTSTCASSTPDVASRWPIATGCSSPSSDSTTIVPTVGSASGSPWHTASSRRSVASSPSRTRQEAARPWSSPFRSRRTRHDAASC